VPAVVLSGLFELRHVGDGQHAAVVPTVIATASAFVVGYASIALLLRYLTNHTTVLFVVYRVLLGALVLTLVATGTIN
jgi:undecaprenyl-diphosphatase